MQTPKTLVACGLRALMPPLLLMPLLLVACQRNQPPKPTVEPVGIQSLPAVPAVPSGTQISVPPADTVFPAVGAANPPATTATRGNKAMTRAEESAAMPMAGQNNDHSAPAAAASRPSSR